MTILVTGATSGVGLETARALAARGNLVIVGARDAARGETVVREIASRGGRAELLPIDLASFASVREAAARCVDAHPELAVLVNNAGVAAERRTETADGHELTWQTNFLGPFLLTRLLLPGLRRAPSARIVNVSSEAHRAGRLEWGDLELRRGWKRLRAYANSKLALNLFTRELARREPAVAANAVHPGVVATRIWRDLPAPLRLILKVVLRSPESGARPVVRLATDPALEGVTGLYFERDREARPAPAAMDGEAAARLWDAAERATSAS